jgi:hypothetical protein
VPATHRADRLDRLLQDRAIEQGRHLAVEAREHQFREEDEIRLVHSRRPKRSFDLADVIRHAPVHRWLADRQPNARNV